MGTKSTENVGKSREDIRKSSKNIAKSGENIRKSKARIGKSKENITKSKENLGKSRENLEKSRSAIGKEPSDETLPNPNFYWGSQKFNLENGDIYEGEYCCHKSGIIWREGEGTYITKDGHTYAGLWENDQLLNSPNSSIVYPSRDFYSGPIIKGKYSGDGTYTFKNKLILKSQFEKNKPVGEITLIDYDDHLWKGQAANDKAMILSVNHFFESISPERGLGKVSLGEILEKDDVSVKKSVRPKESKEQIFAKSNKTKNDFECNRDTSKYSDSTELSALKKGSVKSAPSSFFSVESIDSGSTLSLTLLKTFLSNAYRSKCVPVKMFTATNNKLERLEEAVCEEVEEEMLAEY